jgi:flotillin
MLFWMVPAANEALIVSGSRAGNEATQFRIVTGHGTFRHPDQAEGSVSLALPPEAEIAEERHLSTDAPFGRELRR